jgi:sugar lactone lactonase YvrE/DNA-directed RNA polymerase subunit RPC12/RpoP
MPQTFDCPKCGAPVAFERSSDPYQTATPRVRCDYCHSQLIAPDERVGRPAQVVRIQLGLSGGKAPKWIWLLMAIPILIVVVVGLAALGILAPAFYSVGRAVKEAPSSNPSRPSTPANPNKKSENSFATELLTFGSEGIGPGMFNDARSIGVDGDGRIYVGEYTGGRVQVFDLTGKFLNQWSIGDRKTILRGLATDRKGVVYVAQGGKVARYQGDTGEKLGELAYERTGFDDVAVGADGGLATAIHGNRDDIATFDANGKLMRTISEAISGASGDSELSMRVAVDGSGNVYALGRFNNGVFKFGRDGKFMNRFGNSGDQPGQFRAAYSIAVDGYGRVYVGDVKGIQIFDADGRYLNVIKQKGVAFGMVFNDRNELFVIARDRVIKYSIPAP